MIRRAIRVCAAPSTKRAVPTFPPTPSIARSKKVPANRADSVEELVYQSLRTLAALPSSSSWRRTTATALRRAAQAAGASERQDRSVGIGFAQIQKRGTDHFDAEKHSEDAVTEVAPEAGADDVRAEGDTIVVLTEPGACQSVREAFEKKGMTPLDSEVGMLPELTVALSEKTPNRLASWCPLEEHDDDERLHQSRGSGLIAVVVGGLSRSI